MKPVSLTMTNVKTSLTTHASPIEEFDPMWSGTKRADWRKFREVYEVGAYIDFFEYDFEQKQYTQRWIRGRITHIQRNLKLNMPKEYCILSFEIVRRRLLSKVQAMRLSSIGFADVSNK